MSQISAVNTSNLLKFASIATRHHDAKEALEKKGNLSEKSLKDLQAQTRQELKSSNLLNISLNGVPGSGIDANGKITIAGKLMGLDESFSKAQINELSSFMLSQSFADLPKPVVNKDSFALLDRADISIDEFKKLWSKNQEKIKAELKNGLLAQEKRADEKVEHIKNAKFKPIQAVSKTKTYKDEASSEYRQFYALIAREFNSGKNVFEILKKVAEGRVDKLA
ncbi:hypothetical protein [Campylobacter sp. 19-13652]|uniref:hypothetical protein n=1 Tax=Campylobacter sp. 19-13652 TaxID=2840180 RepID=UPI001C794307|nr:hypothetical protein [Campylobacter sp. 19-13652]BCX79590.1 hypothetical protein LBC_10520 [Campylobacter sp. 19-13652]